MRSDEEIISKGLQQSAPVSSSTHQSIIQQAASESERYRARSPIHRVGSQACNKAKILANEHLSSCIDNQVIRNRKHQLRTFFSGGSVVKFYRISTIDRNRTIQHRSIHVRGHFI